MPLVCVQCSMRALVNETPVPTFDETPEQHAARCHPDPVETLRERKELEAAFREKSQ